MAAVLLPDSPGPADMQVFYVDFGGTLRPALGGEVQRLNRLGNRHRVRVVMPKLRYPDARVWVHRLKRGVHEGVRIEFLQPGFTTALTTAATASAVSGGSSLPLTGLPAGATILEGQYLSIIVDGRRQLYAVDQTSVANESGVASIGVTPLLRSPVPGGTVVEIGQPFIEGTLVGDEQSYSVDLAHHYGLTFDIEEDR